jgi:hypothetical protein
VAAVVGERGVADELLARGPDRRDPPCRAEPLAQPLFGCRGREAPDVAGALAPRTTIASFPVSLPEIAKWLEASASLSMPVSGDLATTANFALVVSGVATSGENTNASGASGPSGSTFGGASRCISQVASPTPPR